MLERGPGAGCAARAAMAQIATALSILLAVLPSAPLMRLALADSSVDCHSDVTHWTGYQRDMCCINHGIGCQDWTTTSTPRPPPARPAPPGIDAAAAPVTSVRRAQGFWSWVQPSYDCALHGQHPLATWTKKQRTYCCAHHSVGCEQEHTEAKTYNCTPPAGNPISSLETWGWTIQQGAWCCNHWGVGCFATTVTTTTTLKLGRDRFDCTADISRWRTDWSPRKSAWCCSSWFDTEFPAHVQGLAGECCALFPHPACQERSITDCHSGLVDWENHWPIDKKMYCCKNFSSTATWPDADIRATCCSYESLWANSEDLQEGSKGCLDDSLAKDFGKTFAGKNNTEGGVGLTFTVLGVVYNRISFTSKAHQPFQEAIQDVLIAEAGGEMHASDIEVQISESNDRTVSVRAEAKSPSAVRLQHVSTANLAKALTNRIRHARDIEDSLCDVCTLSDLNVSSSIFVEPIFDCTDVNVPISLWSVSKRRWCCDHEGIGCRAVFSSSLHLAGRAYDCNAGYDSEEQAFQGWSVDKKNWCCIAMDRGCLFDCEDGYARWDKIWSDRKKEWCCYFKNKGCSKKDPYDCNSGYIEGQGRWVPFGDRSEYLLTEDPMPWEANKALCQSFGAHMVTIHSAEENSFVASLLPRKGPSNERWQYTWIGLEPEVKNTWIDRSDFTYSHWLTGDEYPMYSKGMKSVPKKCASMTGEGHRGGWHESGCNKHQLAVCEKDKWTMEHRSWCCENNEMTDRKWCAKDGVVHHEPKINVSDKVSTPGQEEDHKLDWVYRWGWPQRSHTGDTQKYNCNDDLLPQEWVPAKRAWCCEKQGLGCRKTGEEELPVTKERGHSAKAYDCDAGAQRWAEVWDEAKRAWCCRVTKRGCPEDLIAKSAVGTAHAVPGQVGGPYFQCNDDYENWVRAWTPAKQKWCCKHHRRGCAFECDGDVDGWSVGKRMWCCEHKQKGCRKPEDYRYDCSLGYSIWKSAWPEEKKEWCCRTEQKGCESMGTTVEPFNCGSGSLRNCWRAWSDEKKAWCHKHRGVQCTSGGPATTTTTMMEDACDMGMGASGWDDENAEDSAEDFSDTNYWTPKKLIQCCRRWLWNDNWPKNTRRYCCRKEEIGCPSAGSTQASKPPVTAPVGQEEPTPAFDCTVGYYVAWPRAKQEFCCQQGALGCPTVTGSKGKWLVPPPHHATRRESLPPLDPVPAPAPQPASGSPAPAPQPQGSPTHEPTEAPALAHFDCAAGLWNWEEGWSDAKKKSCCAEHGVGCEKAKFDCVLGRSNWKWGWSPDKKEYCCKQKGMDCDDADDGVTPKGPGTSPPDCNVGLANWKLGWSTFKKEWCCKHQGHPCESKCKWIAFQKSEYCLIDELSTWSEQREKCESLGAHMVSIASSVENGFVVSLMPVGVDNADRLWIGAKPGSLDGWIDGEAMTYKHWVASDQASPDGLDPAAKDANSCPEISRHADKDHWQARVCDKRSRTICKKESRRLDTSKNRTKVDPRSLTALSEEVPPGQSGGASGSRHRTASRSAGLPPSAIAAAAAASLGVSLVGFGILRLRGPGRRPGSPLPYQPVA